MRSLSILTVIVSTAIASAANANVLNVDLNSRSTSASSDNIPNPSTTYTGPTAIDGTTSYAFNGVVATFANAGTGFTSGTLKYSDGIGGALSTDSAITVSLGAYSGSYWQLGGADSAEFAPDLFNDYVYAGTSLARSFSINGLIPGNQYDLYLYASEADFSPYGAAFTINATTQEASGGDVSSFTSGTNYTLFASLTADISGQILGTWAKTSSGPGDRDGGWNGFTLVEIPPEPTIPEPATLTLLALASIPALLHKRRR